MVCYELQNHLVNILSATRTARHSTWSKCLSVRKMLSLLQSYLVLEFCWAVRRYILSSRYSNCQLPRSKRCPAIAACPLEETPDTDRPAGQVRLFSNAIACFTGFTSILITICCAALLEWIDGTAVFYTYVRTFSFFLWCATQFPPAVQARFGKVQ